MKTITITYDEKEKWANVIDVGSCEFSQLQWNDNFEIELEQPDTDSEDFNDNARWFVKTLLAILKLEKEDECAHCDWSADYDKNQETGRYRFNVSIDKVEE